MQKKYCAILLAVALLGPSAYASDHQRYGSSLYESDGKYEGFSGQKYKYDLSDPSDRIEYQMDLDAQMKDRLIAPITPGVDLDRGMGQYGGGIVED